MERQKIEGSSNIISAGYDEDTKAMQVEFVSGKIYQYENVPPTTEEADGRGNWEDFSATFDGPLSTGSYFARNFRQWPDQAAV